MLHKVKDLGKTQVLDFLCRRFRYGFIEGRKCDLTRLKTMVKSQKRPEMPPKTPVRPPYWISNKLRKPVIIKMPRMLSSMLRTMTLPPAAAAAFRMERKMRSPELEM